jgi:hypothetical protein
MNPFIYACCSKDFRRSESFHFTLNWRHDIQPIDKRHNSWPLIVEIYPIMLSVIMQNVVMLSRTIFCVVVLSVFMLSLSMQNVVIQSMIIF